MSVKLISADSHVNPPPDLWLRDAPARLKDRVPRVESTPEGDVWVVDQKASPVQGLTFMGGRDYKDYTPRVAYKEMRPGSWDPQARLADMDQDGILADVLYGGGPSRFDEPELRAFCTQRYNDWLFELERASGGRLVGISILPIAVGAARASSSSWSRRGSAGSRTTSSAWTRPSRSTASGRNRSSPSRRAATGTGRGTRPSSRTIPG